MIRGEIVFEPLGRKGEGKRAFIGKALFVTLCGCGGGGVIVLSLEIAKCNDAPN